jgi:hypothetical protein
MTVTVEIPDDLGKRLAADSNDLSRRALEALALEEFRRDRLTKPELRRMLGLETREALDGFLKAHNILIEYSVEDLEQERRNLRRIGL